MPNIASVLRDEITRLCRRELRKQTATLQKASVTHRRDIAALKRQQASLERTAKELNRHFQKTAIAPKVAKSGKPLRFRVDGFKALRKKLGLSAEQMGKLLGVSGQSIYAWEQKRSTPRRSQLPAIAVVRAMGKREAVARLSAPHS